MKFRILKMKGRYCVQKKGFFKWKFINNTYLGYLSLEDAEYILADAIKDYENEISPSKVIKEIEV